MNSPFKNKFAENIFKAKYSNGLSWEENSKVLVKEVCSGLMKVSEMRELEQMIISMKFLPAGRYLYYAGQKANFYNNCFCLGAKEDTREEWARITGDAIACLMLGGGIGVEYSKFRAAGEALGKTGGIACLTGDTIVYKDRDKKTIDYNNITIAELFKHRQRRPKQWFSQPIYIRSLNEDTGEFFRNRVLDVIDNGAANVYLITTEAGYQIKATDTHRFYSNSGEWKELKLFNKGDMIGVNGRKDKVCIDCGKPINRKAKLRCLTCHNKHQQKATALPTTARQRKQCRNSSKDFCELCGAVNCRFEIHHKDKNVYNNKSKNLINLCCKCHRQEHMKMDFKGDGYRNKFLNFDKIVSIEPVGIKQVFDLSMEAPNHNFIANGFVSHNSGPLPLMNIMNEVGRNVMQGGSRRSALYAALNWSHKDIMQFIHVKNWSKEIRDLKTKDFSFPATLDMTNISVNYDDAFFEAIKNNDAQAQAVWSANINQMLKTAEPGMAFNLGKNIKDILRNACAEFTSEDDSDVCNLGSVNMGNIESIEELSNVSYLASKFLVCGGCRADLPYKRVRYVREKNRKIGLGLMGVHEWMLKRGYKYEMTPDLKIWLGMWKDSGEYGANQMSDKLKINRPKKYRAIAPTGTIGILACTTTGIEPLYAVAYKRRYLTKGAIWNYEYVVDATTEKLIEKYNLDPDAIETAASLANDPERRIKFQYELQKIVDMGISSTLNLPALEDQKFTPEDFSKIVLKYAKGLRGITVYPDGARGGQPLTKVSYKEAKAKIDEVYTECYIGCDTCGS